MPTPQHWLVKSEPGAYSFAQLEKDGQTAWTGIRNFEARNNLRAMKPGDLLLFYHSGEGKEIVGVARTMKAAGPDPTAPKEDWAAIDVAAVKPLAVPVTLSQVRATPALKQFPLLTRQRLSVAPVTREDFALVLELGKTRLNLR